MKASLGVFDIFKKREPEEAIAVVLVWNKRVICVVSLEVLFEREAAFFK